MDILLFCPTKTPDNNSKPLRQLEYMKCCSYCMAEKTIISIIVREILLLLTIFLEMAKGTCLFLKELLAKMPIKSENSLL